MSTIRKNLRAVVVDEEDIAYIITDDTAESGYITIATNANSSEIAIPPEAIDAIIEALKYVSEPA